MMKLFYDTFEQRGTSTKHEMLPLDHDKRKPVYRQEEALHKMEIQLEMAEEEVTRIKANIAQIKEK